jgi:hypothetical protein
VKAVAAAAKRAGWDTGKAGKKAAAAVEEGTVEGTEEGTEEGAPAAPEAEGVPSPSLGAGPAGPPLS